MVALTQTRKHIVGREKKQSILEDIRSTVDKYEHIYVFSTENMRNSSLKELRTELSDSRFYFGRKKIVQVAFGRSAEEEYADGLMKVGEMLKGNVGVFFTNREHEKVVDFFEKYGVAGYARSGFVATKKVVLKEGELEQFEASQQKNLQLVGLPVGLAKGKMMLLKDFRVCNEGDVLTPENAKILEFMGIQMAMFRIRLLCHYQKSDGVFEVMDKMRTD